MNSIHPLSDVGLIISHFKCFGEEGGGFPVFRPINIIIGRNNAGKSALIDAVELCITKGQSYDQQRHARPSSQFAVRVDQLLDETSLRQVFDENRRSGGIPGASHWHFGQQFIGQRIQRLYEPSWKGKVDIAPDFGAIHPDNRSTYYDGLATETRWPFDSCRLLKISAERDMQPETRDVNPTLGPKGNGTTNLVRAFINSDNLPRDLVERDLLNDLNIVYQGDCEFTKIICQENNNGVWELYLTEEKKGDIRLSESGSSLKSIFIILCMLRLFPAIEDISWDHVIFAIEEPENNLHPALLRRLLNFVADQREEKTFTLIITTHSPIAIDWSARRSDSQIIHVQHEGDAAKSRVAIEYRHSREIIEDLDIRASDILQANGVIWVEGPSDRIYVRRWLDLASGQEIKEGVHYTIMFYGGKLLSHLDALPPDENDTLISLLAINRNAAVLIDSDRRLTTPHGQKPRMRINATKQRIMKEMEDIGGFVWITEGREIENYTPIAVFARTVGKPAPSVDPYTQITTLPLLEEFKEDKIRIAHKVAPETQESDLIGHLDVWSKLKDLCSHIVRWNGLSTSN